MDGNGAVVVMSLVPRIKRFRMTRSITHAIKFSMKPSFLCLGIPEIPSLLVQTTRNTKRSPSPFGIGESVTGGQELQASASVLLSLGCCISYV